MENEDSTLTEEQYAEDARVGRLLRELLDIAGTASIGDSGDGTRVSCELDHETLYDDDDESDTSDDEETDEDDDDFEDEDEEDGSDNLYFGENYQMDKEVEGQSLEEALALMLEVATTIKEEACRRAGEDVQIGMVEYSLF